MESLIGLLLALATGGLATATGLGRGRSFYPVVLIVVATYYCLFAVMGGSIGALWIETVIALLFAAAAIIGFRTNMWLVVAALAGHGAMDLVHRHIVANPGVPAWWPGFCASYDITAAAWLAACILLAGRAGAPATWESSGGQRAFGELPDDRRRPCSGDSLKHGATGCRISSCRSLPTDLFTRPESP